MENDPLIKFALELDETIKEHDAVHQKYDDLEWGIDRDLRDWSTCSPEDELDNLRSAVERLVTYVKLLRKHTIGETPKDGCVT
jgi:hypothetical protein